MSATGRWQLRVYEIGQEYERTFPFTGAVQLGRQRDVSEIPFSQHPLPVGGMQRIVIARDNENDVSRTHAVLTPLGGVRFHVENISHQVPIGLPDGGELRPQASTEVVIPATLTFGRYGRLAVRIEDPSWALSPVAEIELGDSYTMHDSGIREVLTFAVVQSKKEQGADEAGTFNPSLTRDALEMNHVFLDGAPARYLQGKVLERDAVVQEALQAGFHRFVVLDAEKGLNQNRELDMERFCAYVYKELAKAFIPHLTEMSYHPEDIAQILKEEARSLFCFLNVQYIPIADLRQLRGFTQEVHQLLLLCCSERNLEEEERNFVRRRT